MFFYEDHSSVEDEKMISAKVVLPCSVDSCVREAQSKDRWTTEKNARRDAAFEAYVALYHAGLINDNLLPRELVDVKEEDAFAAIEKRPNIAEVDQQINMWPYLAKQWQCTTEIHQNTVSIYSSGHQCQELNMLLPLSLPDVEPFRIYWKANSTHEITVKHSTQFPLSETVAVANKATYLIMHSVFRNRMSSQYDFIVLFVPPLSHHEPGELNNWLDKNSGSTKSFNDEGMQGLIRDLNYNRAPYILRSLRLSTHREALALDSRIKGIEQASNSQCLLLEVQKFPKRFNFLHQTAKKDTPRQGQGIKYLLADSCEMDRLPWKMAMLASFVPSILHVIHKTMLVNYLSFCLKVVFLSCCLWYSR